jgi:hypothetical protein
MYLMPRRKVVDDWFAKYENPMKPVVVAMRDAILAADPRIDECIKWQAPTFTYEGNLASFFPRSKQHASLMFHQGSLIPGKHPRLEGTGVGRSMKIGTVEEVAKAKKEIVAIVKAWCDAREAAKAAPKAKAKAKPKPKAKAKPKRR